MTQMLDLVIQGGLSLLIFLLLPGIYRFLRGPSPADRLQAVDSITTLLIGVILMLALLQESGLLIDIAIALAAFGFISTLALARYLAEGRVF